VDTRCYPGYNVEVISFPTGVFTTFFTSSNSM